MTLTYAEMVAKIEAARANFKPATGYYPVSGPCLSCDADGRVWHHHYEWSRDGVATAVKVEVKN